MSHAGLLPLSSVLHARRRRDDAHVAKVNLMGISLGGVAFGQTVLMRATLAAGLEWDTASAHSAAASA